MEIITIVGLVMLTASSGALFKPDRWYDELRKPSWTPSPWVFPVVWTVLYLAIAVAGWLVWREAGWSGAIAIWGLQLALNAAWSGLFFGLKRVGLAFVDVVALQATIVLFIVWAQPISWIASVLFVPYLVWVTTAAALNLRVLQMNPRVWSGGRFERLLTGERAT